MGRRSENDKVAISHRSFGLILSLSTVAFLGMILALVALM